MFNRLPRAVERWGIKNNDQTQGDQRGCVPPEAIWNCSWKVGEVSGAMDNGLMFRQECGGSRSVEARGVFESRSIRRADDTKQRTSKKRRSTPEKEDQNKICLCYWSLPCFCHDLSSSTFLILFVCVFFKLLFGRTFGGFVSATKRYVISVLVKFLMATRKNEMKDSDHMRSAVSMHTWAMWFMLQDISGDLSCHHFQ